MRKKRARRASLWYCTTCQVSGEATSKRAAREGLILHFMSDSHSLTVEKVETLDLHRRLAAKGRRRI